MLKALPSLRIARLDALHRMYRSRTLARHLLGSLAMSLLLAPTLAVAADFGELVDDLATASPYTFVDDGVLSDIVKWDDIQQKSLAMADLTVGHLEGVGHGWVFKTPIQIHFRIYRNRQETRGGIVISSGRTEGVPLYQELIYDLLKNGYSVYIHDHRGQGFSSRLRDDNIGYVDDFSNYVTDLAAFVAKVQQQRPSGSKPLFLLAHSMGGAIAALYLGSGQPTPFAAAALVTPMMEPWANGDPSLGRKGDVAQYVCDKGASLGFEVPFLSPTIVDGQADFDAMEKAGRANTGLNGLTQSSSRYRHNWDARAGRCEPMQSEHCGSPTAKVSGSSLRWFLQACKASLSARTQEAKEIGVPVLLLQGGKDQIVNPEAQKTFCQNMNAAGKAKCTGVLLPTSQHATLIEQDGIRKPALAAILSHFECAAAGGGGCRQIVK